MSFGSIFVAIIAGYLVGIAAQAALGWLITRESRGLLVQGERMSPMFQLQVAISWVVASAAAVLVATSLTAFLPPLITCVVAGLLAIVQVRNHGKQAPQQTVPLTLLCVACICVGGLGAYLLKPQH